MKQLRYAENIKVLPLLAPQDIVATATPTSYLDMDLLHNVTLAVQFGSMTSDSTDSATVTVQCSTAGSSNATEVAVGFNYRVTGAVNTDALGAITAATSDGVALTADAADNKVLLINIDASAIANVGADYRFIRAVITPNAEMGACLVGVVAYGDTRYSSNVPPSST